MSILSVSEMSTGLTGGDWIRLLVFASTQMLIAVGAAWKFTTMVERRLGGIQTEIASIKGQVQAVKQSVESVEKHVLEDLKDRVAILERHASGVNR